MAIYILLIGVFITIAIKKTGIPIFKTKALDMVHLAFFLLAIALSIVNTTFVQLIPNDVMTYVSIIIILPLVIKFIKRNEVVDAKKESRRG
ncbi:hypothetical protein ABC345_21320 [Shouchella sp. 1P09AA]|uniref:hypothetical protein n=1 Tax=unclassified Shouchella TaxID=2893065 RepID=UPI00399FED4C